MEQLLNFLRLFNDPQHIIEVGGLFLLVAIIFIENGLIIGMFFPGDSLLFIAGLLTATQPELLRTDLGTLQISLIIAAILGNATGYWFGKRWGKKLYQRPDGFIFKRKYLEATERYYEKNGGKTLILARFLPYIRTLAPIIAGVIRVSLARFWIYNIIGAVFWILFFTYLGFYLGSTFPGIKDYLGYVVAGFIVLATFAVYRTYRNNR